MPAQVTLSDVADTTGSGVSRRLLIDGSKTFVVPVLGGNK